MRLIDVNVLVYAYRRDAPGHAAYRRWLEQCVASDQPCGLAEWRFPGLRWRHPLEI